MARGFIVRIAVRDPRKNLDERLDQQAIRADDAKMRYTMSGTGKYRGSNRESDDRAGRNLPRRSRR